MRTGKNWMHSFPVCMSQAQAQHCSPPQDAEQLSSCSKVLPVTAPWKPIKGWTCITVGNPAKVTAAQLLFVYRMMPWEKSSSPADGSCLWVSTDTQTHPNGHETQPACCRSCRWDTFRHKFLTWLPSTSPPVPKGALTLPPPRIRHLI